MIQTILLKTPLFLMRFVFFVPFGIFCLFARILLVLFPFGIDNLIRAMFCRLLLWMCGYGLDITSKKKGSFHKIYNPRKNDLIFSNTLSPLDILVYSIILDDFKVAIPATYFSDLVAPGSNPKAISKNLTNKPLPIHIPVVILSPVRAFFHILFQRSISHRSRRCKPLSVVLKKSRVPLVVLGEGKQTNGKGVMKFLPLFSKDYPLIKNSKSGKYPSIFGLSLRITSPVGCESLVDIGMFSFIWKIFSHPHAEYKVRLICSSEYSFEIPHATSSDDEAEEEEQYVSSYLTGSNIANEWQEWIDKVRKCTASSLPCINLDIRHYLLFNKMKKKLLKK
eukprot:gnl/Carplike_NY0171/970_a1334_1433.p1 GENE.gnl/Carplike_NY0171/970_a1334_1433~~gnl/Carplike_NY0171/970_a1334_1433.p1  ORF type:complete len:373 (+),score=81.98 gnl/Carplike_NY0171/970_a1334_1433:113-1120(+)